MIIQSAQSRHRAVLAVDIENSTARTNVAKAALRDAMYDLVTKALTASGIGADCRDPFIDRGDGILILIPPVDRVPKTLLLSSVIPTLHRLLTGYNARHPEDQFRFRCVVHAGEVVYDSRGPFGETLDLAFRLLDAPEVKSALRRAAAPLVLVISDDLYRSVVRQHYSGIGMPFEPAATVWIADTAHRGWLYVPGSRTARRAG